MKEQPSRNPTSDVRHPTSACPHADTLAAFSRGELSEAEGQAVAEHLETCAACWRKAEASPLDPALADDLKWVSELEAETVVDVNVPLARLSAALPDYEIIREIGRGGMGIVFEARQVKLGRRVAVKVLPALLGAVRPDAIARFRREAELAAGLEHTNIIGVYDFGEVEGTFYYTMPLIEGRSLHDVLGEIAASGAIDVVLEAGSSLRIADCGLRIEEERQRGSDATSDVGGGTPEAGGLSETRSAAAGPAAQSAIRGPVPLVGPQSEIRRLGSSSRTDRAYYRRVATWMADVAEALDYAHEQGVIHRDVKPSNLLLSRTGRLMISDFGLARPLQAATLTATRALLGTARYMAPEQVDARGPQADRRVDVYGLGATLYELLAFRPVFAAADDREVLDCVLNQEPTPPHRFVRQVPRELETIALKALEKDRAARYATAKDLADDLRRWLLDLPIRAKRPSLPTRMVKFVRRRKLAAALGALAAVGLLVSGVLWVAYGSSRREAAQSRSVAQSRGGRLLLLEAGADVDRGAYPSALGRLDELLSEQPDLLGAQLLRARCLWQMRRSGDAIGYLEAVVARTPDCWPAHYQLASMYKDADDTKAAWHRAQVERLMPETVESHYLRARGENDAERAVALLNAALELDPGHVDAVLERASRYCALKRYDAMLADAERAVAMRPTWSVTHGLRGQALALLERWAEARAAADRALELEPDFAMWWNNRSDADFNLQRFADSIADADEALRLDPRMARAYVCRARSRAAVGDLDGALADFAEALASDPAYADTYLQRSLVYGKAGRWEDVASDASHFIDLRPNESDGYHNRGIAYVRLGQYDKAMADFGQEIEVRQGDAGAYHVRAQACLWMLRFDEAIADLTHVLELEPRNAVVRMRRGMAYELAGASASALADYERVAVLGDNLGAYAVLWKYLLLRQIGREAAAAELLAATKSSVPGAGGWTGRLFELFAGGVSPDDLLAAATGDDARCEAHYYIGMQALLAGQRERAAAAFTACVALDRTKILESVFARTRLERMQAGRSSSAATSAPAS
jgi:serine/threonine protein kinase/lipoprotein NlpI